MSTPQQPSGPNPQYPPAGQPLPPQNPYPTQPGYPAQLPPQGYPGQPAPQGYPGQPSYPTQQGPQGYPTQPGATQPFVYPAQQPGMRPPVTAPPPKGNKTVLGIVIAGVVALGLLGVLLMTLFGRGTPTAGPTTVPTISQPTEPAPPTTSPTFAPTEEPTEEPTTTTPTEQPTTQPTTPDGALEVGLGISVVPADGWESSYRDETKNYTELTNGKAILVTQAFRVDQGTEGTQVVDAYLKQLASKMTKVEKGQAKALDVGNQTLSVGMGAVRGTKATSQGSLRLTYNAIISVRQDGLTMMSTLITETGVDPQSLEKDYLAMTTSLLNSQLAA